jgi:hypothetical protein
MEHLKTSSESSAPTRSATPGLVLLGLPIVLACGVVLTFLFHAVGIRQRSGPALSSLITIIVGTRMLFVFQDRFRNPSGRLLIAGMVSFVVVAVIIWARLTDRIPAPN